jgi:hypothetical protein
MSGPDAHGLVVTCFRGLGTPVHRLRPDPDEALVTGGQATHGRPLRRPATGPALEPQDLAHSAKAFNDVLLTEPVEPLPG